MKVLCLLGGVFLFSACTERKQSNLPPANRTVSVDYVLTGTDQKPKQLIYSTGQTVNVDYLLIGNDQSVPYPTPQEVHSGTSK